MNKTIIIDDDMQKMIDKFVHVQCLVFEKDCDGESWEACQSCSEKSTLKTALVHATNYFYDLLDSFND